MAIEKYFDVVDSYNKDFAPKVIEYSNEYIDNLVKETNFDIEDNEKNTKKINKLSLDRFNVNKKTNRFKALKVFLWLLNVVLIITIVLSSLFLVKRGQNPIAITLIAISPLLIILFTVLIFIVIKPKIKNGESIIADLDSKINERKKDAKQKLYKLVMSFDTHIDNKIINKVLPIINFDKYLDIEKYNQLKNNFGYNPKYNENQSVTYVKSGDINNNPFLLRKTLNFRWSTKTYYGQRTVSWLETYTDSDGKIRTRTRYQTLVASVVKPYPSYQQEYELIYANEHCERLSFSRYPNNLPLQKKNLEKIIEKEYRKLESKQKKITEKGGNFTLLNNSEFEVLFNAHNRDNEQQFRVLFTAFAQTQMVKLIKDTTTCSDNFKFVKENMLNYIYPYFINTNFEFDMKYLKYLEEYDFKTIKDDFIKTLREIFYNLYFTFAPLLTIPSYQENKLYKYNINEKTRLFEYQQEEVLNKLSQKHNLNSKSVTDNIIKSKYLRTEGNYEIVKAIAKGHFIIPRIDFVSVMAQNGNIYEVPVNWDEYNQVEEETECKIDKIEETKLDDLYKKTSENEGTYIHNLICTILKTQN